MIETASVGSNRLSRLGLTDRELVLMVCVSAGVRASFAISRAVITTDDSIARAYAQLAVESARIAWGAALDGLQLRDE